MTIKRRKSNTCIAAVTSKDGRIYMSGDRRSTLDYSEAQSMPKPKINKREGLLLGGTGSGYICDLIVDQMIIPEGADTLDPNIYMHHKFFNEVKKILIAKNYSDEHKLLKIPAGEECLVAVAIQGLLFTVTIMNPAPWSEHMPTGNISVDQVVTPYATGCGGGVALGALKALQGDSKNAIKLKLLKNYSDIKPLNYYNERPTSLRSLEEYQLYYATRVACDVSPGCGLPIDIVGE